MNHDRIEILEKENQQLAKELTWFREMFGQDARMLVPEGEGSPGRESTEQKSAEESLRDSEERARLILNSAAEAIYGIDGSGHCTFCNQSCLDMLGYESESNLLGRNMHDLIHYQTADGSFHPEENCEIYDAFKKGEKVHLTGETLFKADGTAFPVELWAYPTQKNGEVTGAVISFIDISERLMNEEKLRLSEERYRALFENSPQPYQSLDENGRFIDINPAWLKTLGYQREEVIGNRYRDFLHPDWQAHFDQKFPEFKRRGSVDNVEFEIRHKLGHYLSISFKGCIGYNADGSFRQTYCIFEDITTRKQAEKESEKSEQNFRLLVENAPDAVFVRDKESFTYLNNAAIQLFGADSAQDLIGTPIIERYHPDYRDIIRQRIQIINEQRTAVPKQESVCLRLDGSEIHVETAAVPINYRGEDGGLVFMRDITERMDAQQHHRQLEEQLHQSQKIESLGRLAGGVAHDYNNMLGVIIGNVELAKIKAAKSAPINGNLEQILQAANRSRDITRQLLTFASKQIISPKVIDLNEAIEGTLKMLRNLLGENIDLSWQPKRTLWPVKMDPTQLDQILANLCVNARDAIADVGKMTIETKTAGFTIEDCEEHEGLNPGDYVMLAVSDTGCGMDRETLENIFEPFFTTKGTGKGTGLGLATVYGIVRQSGGFINVSSEPGRGTTFRIYLPRCTDDSEEEQKATDSDLPMGQGETVLVVEDEAAIMTLTTAMLEGLDYRVLAANSPAEALTLTRGHSGKIQLLLTDVVMPEMNGRDLANQIASSHPDIKTLYMSGYTADVIAHHGVLDKGIHFLQKPFSLQDLGRHIKEALSPDRVSQAS